MEDLVFSTTDVFNRKVDLKQSTWEDKILNTSGANVNHQHGNSHPEMNDYQTKFSKLLKAHYT